MPRSWVAAVAAILALSLAGMLWMWFKPHPAPVSTPVIATPSKAVAHVATETIQTPLKVYRPESKKRLNLPKSLQEDKAEHVAASSTIKPDDHPHTVTTLVNDQTGEVTTYDTREPLPWIAVDSHGEAGIGYGLKYSPAHGFGPMARLTVRQNLIDVKAAKVSLQGTLDQDGAAFAGVFVTVGW